MPTADNQPANVPAPSKGMAMIAAYRAARLAGRPSLRSELQTARAAMRADRLSRLGHAREPTTPAASAAPVANMVSTATDEGGHAAVSSVFAGLIDAASPAEAQTAAQVEPDAAPPDAPPTVEPIFPAAIPAILAEFPPPEAPAAPPPTPPRAITQLDSLGFGPGMLIRLNQLGIHSADDLAIIDAPALRTALGDISRLINVEAWIERAQEACR